MPSTKYQLWALHFHFVVFHRNTGWLSRTKSSCRLLRMRFCWEIKVEIYRLVHKFWLRAWFASIKTDKSILTYRIRQTGKIGRHFGSFNVFYVHVTQSYLHRLIVEYKLRQLEKRDNRKMECWGGDAYSDCKYVFDAQNITTHQYMQLLHPAIDTSRYLKWIYASV